MRNAILLIPVLFASMVATAKPIRVGWQIPWAVQGQLVQILKHTEILKSEGIEVEFIGKSFGPELNELAMAGLVDVILTADQPAATLFAKNENWVGVSRLMYNRTATYAPIRSEIKTMKDLKGKTVGVPFGAAAQRIFINELKANGLNVESDVKAINLGIQEQMPLMVKGGAAAKQWDQFDALVGFDPVPAIAETRGLAKMLQVGKVCSLVVMNKEFIGKDKKQAQKFVAAIGKAYDYYKANTAQANKWFLEESKLVADDKALELAASLEPNLKPGKISMGFSEEDYQIMSQAAQFVEKAAGKLVVMKDRVSESFLK